MNRYLFLFLSVILSATVSAQNHSTVAEIELSTNGAPQSYVVNSFGRLKPGFSHKASTQGSFFIRANWQTTGSNVASPHANYVRVETPLVPLTADKVGIATSTDKLTAYEYLDGVGRSIQSVQVKSSPSEKDVVTFHLFDDYARESKQYLPYTIEGNGKLRSSPEAEALHFYQNAQAVAHDNEPYSINNFEESPGNRVKETFSPGWNWHHDTGSIPNSNTFGSNQREEVIKWSFTGGMSFPDVSGHYPTNVLQVKQETDASGTVSKVYSDFVGNAILVKKGDGITWHSTYQIYDDVNNLSFVFPPEAVNRIDEYTNSSDKQEFLDRWCFQYKHDDLNRITGKRLPGAGWQKIIYDRWDRPVFTQDAVQRQENLWLFTKYDVYNRAVLTGQITGSESSLANGLNANAARYESLYPNSIGYTNNSFPSHSESNLLTITYYDSYSFINYPNWSDAGQNYSYVPEAGYPKSGDIHQIAFPTSAAVFTTTIIGYQTGSKVKVLNTNDWLNSVTYYDKKYQTIQIISENAMHGMDRHTNLYDFPGRLLKTLRTHTTTGNSLSVLDEFTYDKASHVLKSYCQINSGTKVLMTSNTYNELGQLIEKNIHSTNNGVSYLQSVDYRYGLQGWLTSINNSKLENDNVTNNDTNDLFGMNIIYNDENIDINGTSLKKVYNGNISAIKWKTNNLIDQPVEQIFGFDYDAYNRMEESYYATQNNGSWTGALGLYTEKMNYDQNGNILSLQRNGKVQGQPALIDDLTYQYASLSKSKSNVLRHVYDKSSYWQGNASFGYTEAEINHANYVSDTEGANNTEYEYDENGNLKVDYNKSIIDINYNHLNLPEKITFTNNRQIEYTYDATGDKIKSVVKETSPLRILSSTDYAGGVTYIDSRLSFFSTGIGRAVNSGNGFEYEYTLKDHQNNVRVVFGAVAGTDNYLATMEPERAAKEDNAFLNILRDGTFNHTISNAEIPVPSKSAAVNAVVSGGSAVGPAKVLTLHGGDNVKAEVFAHFTTLFANPNTVVANLVSSVTGVYNILPVGETQALYNAFHGNLPGQASAIPAPTGIPKAYLCYIIFEKSGATYNYTQFGYYPVDGGALAGWQPLRLDVHVPDNYTEGFMYVYVVNETSIDASSTVFFDDFSIVHQKNQSELQVLQAMDYYPFGLSFNEYTKQRIYETDNTGPLKDIQSNRLKFQEQELQDEFDLTWYQFKYRMHDPALGRFGALDPLSEKYLYNSPYAFSENRLIDGIELEGAEFTYNPAFTAGLFSSYNSHVNQFSNDIDGGYIWGAVSMAGNYFKTGWNSFVNDFGDWTLGAYSYGKEQYDYKNSKGFYASDLDQGKSDDINSLMHAERSMAFASQSIGGYTRFASTILETQAFLIGGLEANAMSSYTPRISLGGNKQAASLLKKTGGRLGNESTRKQIAQISTELESRGYSIRFGGGRNAEEYLKPLVKGRRGGSYVDITASHPNYGVLRINTVDVYKNGLPTIREINNAIRIRSQIGPGQHLLLIPKR